MINIEQEIEQSLERFRRLNNRGNMRDANETLHHVLRLMLGMIKDRTEIEITNTGHVDAVSSLFFGTQFNDPSLTDADQIGQHIAIDSAALLHPEAHNEIADQYVADPPPTAPAPAPKPEKPVSAPHGLTANGNPKRIRPPKEKK